jgi:tellurite resistance protein TerC
MATIGTPLFWTVFLAGVLAILVLDLGVLNRKAHVVKPREAMLWVGFCVALAALFAGWLFWKFGARVGLEFVTGYLIEYALSVDNLFVFLVVFSYFAVPGEFQHRVLFWGIVGALVLRAVFILAGAALLAKFHWMIYVFGGFLVLTGIKLLFSGEGDVDPEKNPILKLARRFLPVTSSYHGQRFFVIEAGKRYATPLFLVLLVIEATDVVFAVDSIPAIFGVTRDPFLVFTSNIFAILGLRALYFLLADFMGRFHYLKYGLGLVLAFVGFKMVGSAWFKVPIGVSLGVIATLLGGSVAASWLFPPKPEAPVASSDQK